MGITAMLKEQGTGDDVDDTAHGVRAVYHRGRATQYLHAICHQCLIAVAEGMAKDALILRMTIDEYQHLTSTARDAAQVDTACRTR